MPSTCKSEGRITAQDAVDEYQNRLEISRQFVDFAEEVAARNAIAVNGANRTMQTQIITLPQTGYVRQSLLVGDIKTGTPGILPFSASTLWRRVRAKSFPAPVRLSERVTAWKAEDVRRWLDAQGKEAA